MHSRQIKISLDQSKRKRSTAKTEKIQLFVEIPHTICDMRCTSDLRFPSFVKTNRRYARKYLEINQSILNITYLIFNTVWAIVSWRANREGGFSGRWRSKKATNSVLRLSRYERWRRAKYCRDVRLQGLPQNRAYERLTARSKNVIKSMSFELRPGVG